MQLDLDTSPVSCANTLRVLRRSYGYIQLRRGTGRITLIVRVLNATAAVDLATAAADLATAAAADLTILLQVFI